MVWGNTWIPAIWNESRVKEVPENDTGVEGSGEAPLRARMELKLPASVARLSPGV